MSGKEQLRQTVIGEHFYQPPRKASHRRIEDRRTAVDGIDWNARIADECYIPQTKRGTLSHVSFDFYATLRHEMQFLAPSEIPRLREAMQDRGVGDPFLHVLLPDLDIRDKEILLMAGRLAFEQETGFAPRWLWVPETAIDTEVLAVAKKVGYTGVLCAPEQIEADQSVESRPVKVDTGRYGNILVLPFDRPFSSSLAFDPKANADSYTRDVILPRLNQLPVTRPLLAWTDGETFGHHAMFADLFLDYLVTESLPTAGVSMLGINQLDQVWTKSDYIQGRIKQRSAWSCPHGDLIRWHGACPCDGGFHGAWKQIFSQALSRANTEVTSIVDDQLGIGWRRELSQRFGQMFEFSGSANTRDSLLAAKASILAALTSCGTFFDSPTTSGRINILFVRQAVEHLMDAQQPAAANHIVTSLARALSTATNPHTGERLDSVFGDLIVE
jgi:hypothetical protein